jgi:hypothetical protein
MRQPEIEKIKPSEDPAYLDMMQEARKNLQLSLIRFAEQDPTFQTLSQEKKVRFKNLYLTQSTNASADFPSFDDLWRDIKHVFDESRDYIKSPNLRSRLIAFKRILQYLVDAGLPFVDGKQVSFWCTRFARAYSAEYASRNPLVIDATSAQSALKKIFLKWPDKQLFIFHAALKTPSPGYPELSQLFWRALSEFYAEQIKVGDCAHLFFQHSITIGNFFWNAELPIIQQKNAQLILHRYDTTENRWCAPVSFYSPEANLIRIQRRNVHPSEDDRGNSVMEANIKIWKQSFESNNNDNPLVSSSAPALLTLEKIRDLVSLFRSKATKSKSYCSTHPTPSSTS